MGYGRTQFYQHVCLCCGDLFFCQKDYIEYEDLFCDWCTPKESLLKQDNFSPIKYLGNVVGWVVKCETEFKRRSRLNYKKCYIRDAYTCQYCNYSVGLDPTFRPLHIDHIKPWSASGGNSLNNLVVACSLCNCIANNKIFTNFSDKKTYILEKLEKKNQVVL